LSVCGGAVSGSRASMAVTIIGGQILCLLLTLLITPVVYSYFDGLSAWRPSDMLNPVWKLFRPRGIPSPQPVKSERGPALHSRAIAPSFARSCGDSQDSDPRKVRINW